MINYSTPSGQKSVSVLISANPGALCGVDMQPPASGQATLMIYDSESSSTSGRLILAEIYCDAGMNGVNHEFFIPIAVNRGIYADLTGTTSFNVRYMIG